MNAELGATEEKIRNLESKDTLTFTEQAELEKLKEQNSELEKSIQLEEKKKQATAREVVTDIRKNQKTLDTDFDSSLNTYKATQDKLEKAKAAGYDGTVDLVRMIYHSSPLMTGNFTTEYHPNSRKHTKPYTAKRNTINL